MSWSVYYTIEHAQARLLRCVGDGSPLTLPEEIELCPVTAIGPDCFAAGTMTEGPGLFPVPEHAPPAVERGPGPLERVKLPEGLRSIGPRAFAGCKGLKRLLLPPGLETLGQRAFEGCGLERADLPRSLTALPEYAFAQCRSLSRLTLPDTLTTLGHHCFYNCRALEELVLPPGVTFAGEGLLQNCHALRRLTAPLGAGLGVLLSDLTQPLTLTVPLGGETARFFLPGFSYEYESITAPRVWRTITYGAGQLYRECFSTRDIDFDLYERYFATALIQDELADTVHIALCRLRWPCRLSPQGRKQYLDHVQAHWDTALSLLMAEDDLPGLEALLALAPPDRSTLDALTAQARRANRLFFVSRLMEAGMGRSGADKTFDL